MWGFEATLHQWLEVCAIDDANDAEDADAADFAAGGDMPTASQGGEWATAKLLTDQPGRGSSVLSFHAIGDSSPPNTLLKQEFS